MNYAIDYSDCLPPEQPEPTKEEIAKVADSIEAHLKLDEANWQSFAKDYLDHNVDEPFRLAMRAGEWADAGMLLHKRTCEQFREKAEELASSYLLDELLKHENDLLREWRPIKYAALGRKYHLAELLS